MRIPRLLIIGHPQHGVARYAHDLAIAVAQIVGGPIVGAYLDECGAEAITATLPRVHIHVTDRIFGASPEEAADRVIRMAANRHLTVTLHDLPQPSDGELNLRRRSEAYRRIAHAAASVAVNSVHELALFTRYIDSSPANPPAVIALGSRTRKPSFKHSASNPMGAAQGPVILLAGFIYPGKGHEEVIRAAAQLGVRLHADGVHPTLRVRALGAVSAGHDIEQRRLSNLGTALGIRFEVSGFLDDVDYNAELAKPGIPVAAHQHISASRTMLDWVDAGRKPLVRASPYALEMDRLRPGTLTIFDSERLVDELETAWRDPQSTYLSASCGTPWTLTDAARAYVSWWNRTGT